MSLFLTHDDIVQVTGRRRAKAQCRALDRAGIPYTRNADGWPVVLWADYSRMTGTEPVEEQPDFSAIRRAS